MLDAEKLMAWPFTDVEQTFTARDTILYALSVGMGADPTDARALPFVYEKSLRAMPTMPLVLGMSDVGFMTDPAIGIDMTKLVHGESALALHAPLPVSGTIVSRMSIDAIVDKGADKGAIVQFSRRIADKTSGSLLATESGSFFLRGNGGFGGASASTEPAIGERSPERAPDVVRDVPTPTNAALLYRLNGDVNPLHADPEVARAAGFGRPILHGACGIGLAGAVLLRELCGFDPRRLRSIGVRFSGVIYPGETLRFELWDGAEGKAWFRCKVVERDAAVLANGVADILPII